MSIYDAPIKTLHGDDTTLGEYKGKAVLIVNVASKCGLTPQYTALEELQKKYADQGFSVLGFPCNQFGGQEPGTPEEIEEFCSTNYGISFPLYEKIDVNGQKRHAVYQELTTTSYTDGTEPGDVKWNFEKFLLSPEGEIVARFKPTVVPDDHEVTSAIEANLPS
jgi:glutathione peroxidase